MSDTLCNSQMLASTGRGYTRETRPRRSARILLLPLHSLLQADNTKATLPAI